MRQIVTCQRIAAVAAAAATALAAPAVAGPPYTEDFDVAACTFVAGGRQNPYFSLKPGDTSWFEGEEDGELVEVRIQVKNQTRGISFVTVDGVTVHLTARVVEEREWADEELTEVSRNWFARCKETNDVFYFGEDVDNYEDGVIVDHEGSWEAGVDGALPGIIIPARFLLASRYYQEVAPEVALDRAQHVDMGLTVEAAGETFDRCVAVLETSPLEPDAESSKVYCPGVGLVMDDELALVEYDR